MNITINAIHMPLTDEIREYATKKIMNLEKFITGYGEDAFIQIELGKTTNHHRLGDIFRAEINVRVSGREFRAVSEKDNLYTAIDDAEGELHRELVSYKDKKQTLFKKGASKMKAFIKSFRKRNN